MAPAPRPQPLGPASPGFAPSHPYGVRGVGETPIIPPMAAITSAIEQAIGIRFNALPMSPPKVLAAIEASNNRVADAAE